MIDIYIKKSMGLNFSVSEYTEFMGIEFPFPLIEYFVEFQDKLRH